MAGQTTDYSNNGTFDGLDAQLDITLPNVADDDFTADIQLSESGVAPTINVVFAIDRSGSSGGDTEIDFDGDGKDDTFLEAQVFALETQLEVLEAAGYDPANITVTIVDYTDTANSFTRTLDNKDELIEYAEGLVPDSQTNYEAALSTIESSLTTNGASDSDTNIVYFYSDGKPQPSDQDFSDELQSLEDAFSPAIFGVGFGDNTDEEALAEIDSSGSARIVENEQDLQDLVDTPPPLPEVENFQVFVDGVLVETLEPGDTEVVPNPTGFTITGLDVSGYATTDNTEQTANVEVVVNFTNGHSLTTNGPVKIIDGIVEGTSTGDLIDINYEDDPEGDKIDNHDNVDDTAPPEACNDDVVFGFGGDDTINAALGDDVMTGGIGNDTFVEIAGEGSDTITDFGADDTGTIDDGDQTNNDFVDLASFYNKTTLDAVNNADSDPSNDFDTAIDVLRADAEDGKIDGIIDGVDYSSEIGDVDLTLLNGGNAVTGTDLTFDNTNVACFVRGTQIATRRGSVAIEDLEVGDEVITMDHGFQKIRWIGSTTVAAEGNLAPVVIRKGAMGNERDLRVSPQHRMLVRGWHVELMFGETEALVPAKALINDETVFPLEGGTVEYFHVMFDCHELIYAENIPSESFHPGHVGLGSFAEDTREEILTLFPQLRADAAGYSEHVRPSLKFREAKVLAENPELMRDP
jgi:hypothetical protein